MNGKYITQKTNVTGLSKLNSNSLTPNSIILNIF